MSNHPTLKLTSWPFDLALWENMGESGHPYYNGKLQKTIKRKDGTGYDRHEIPINDRDFLVIAAMCQEAFSKTKLNEFSGAPTAGATTAVDLNAYASTPKAEEVDTPW
jgi:hypothetical protein